MTRQLEQSAPQRTPSRALQPAADLGAKASPQLGVGGAPGVADTSMAALMSGGNQAMAGLGGPAGALGRLPPLRSVGHDLRPLGPDGPSMRAAPGPVAPPMREADLAHGAQLGATTRRAQAPAPAPKAPAAAVAQDLGEVSSLDGAFAALGAAIDLLTPLPGQGFSGSFKLTLKPPQGGGFYLRFSADAAVKRTFSQKVEYSGTMAVVIGAAGTVARLSAHVGARGQAAFKATGDSGYECARLAGLGLHDAVSGISPKVADWVFGKGFEADVVSQMAPKSEGDATADSVELTGELGVEVGSGGRAAAAGHEGKGEAKLAAGYRGKRTLARANAGDTKATAEVEHAFMLNLAVEGKAGPVSLSGGVDLSWVKGKSLSWGLNVEVAAESKALSRAAALPVFVASALSSAFGMARNQISIEEKRGRGEATAWDEIRTALAVPPLLPVHAVSAAMAESRLRLAPDQSCSVAISVTFEGSSVKNLTVELLTELGGPEAEGGGLTKSPLSVEGKHSTELLNHTPTPPAAASTSPTPAGGPRHE